MKNALIEAGAEILSKEGVIFSLNHLTAIEIRPAMFLLDDSRLF